MAKSPHTSAHDSFVGSAVRTSLLRKEELAREAVRLAGHKLPVPMKFVKRA